MSFISTIVGAIVFLSAVYFGMEDIYLLITASVTLMYVTILALNGLGKIYWSRMVNATVSPVWISLGHLFIGGFFSQSLAICSSIVFSYVSFRSYPKLRLAIIIYSIIIFELSVIYVTINEPIWGIVDFPFDDIIVFLSTIGWIIGILFLFNDEQDEYIRSLNQKNIQLEKAKEELERFSYIASHDLKSPLRTITSFIGLIERDIKKEKFDSIEEKLHFVKSGAEQMNFLVEDILELSKLNSTGNAKREMVDLNIILEKAKANLQEDISQKNVKIKFEKLPFFKCNEVEFLLLFQNFIQNGIKYNRSEQPIISIYTIETDDKLSICFRDNGIGIAEQYHEQIFQFFKRLHNSDEYQGTGLGLGLCKKIIDSHHGEVIIDSEENVGSIFTLTFPKQKEQQKEIKRKVQAVTASVAE